MKKPLIEWPVDVNLFDQGDYDNSSILNLAKSFQLVDIRRESIVTGTVRLGLIEILNYDENFLPRDNLEERIIERNVAGVSVWRHFENNPENNIPYSWRDQEYNLCFKNVFKWPNNLDSVFLPNFYINSNGLWKSGLKLISDPFAPIRNKKARFVCII